jgi:uncharacterized protein YukE
MGSGFEIDVQAVLRTVATLDGLLSDFDGSIQEVNRVTTPSGSYGQVGSAAAVSSRTTQDQLVTTLQALTSALKQVSQRVRTSADGYVQDDAAIAAVLAQIAAAERTAFNQHRDD